MTMTYIKPLFLKKILTVRYLKFVKKIKNKFNKNYLKIVVNDIFL